jgi:hypothetical protein
MWSADLHCRHFAFRGEELSLLALAAAGSQQFLYLRQESACHSFRSTGLFSSLALLYLYKNNPASKSKFLALSSKRKVLLMTMISSVPYFSLRLRSCSLTS